MNAEIESAIKKLTGKAADATEPHHAMNFAQAVLNLAHAKAVLESIVKK